MPCSPETPVLFCNFNRPELTARVFESIRSRQPKTLFLACDGPRAGNVDDVNKVDQVRKLIADVDWPCDVRTRFVEENLGCKKAIASAIDWAFEQTEELIILEDDCVPDPTFFDYCQELLHRYREDDRVMMISGNNFQDQPVSEASYYFSRWTHIWGWATWKRAWQHFDVDVKSWPKVKSAQQLRSVVTDPIEYDYWSHTLDMQHAGSVDTWDFPWCYAVWAANGLSILPNRNLVSNIGFGSEATHTTDPESALAGMKVWPLTNLVHPESVSVNKAADDMTWKNIFLPHAQATAKEAAPRDRSSKFWRRLKKLTGRAA